MPPHHTIEQCLIQRIKTEALCTLRRLRRREGLMAARACADANVADASPSPLDVAHEHHLRDLLERAIATLPARCQQAYRLHRIDGLTARQAADVLGISVRTVQVQLLRADKRLRAVFGLIRST